VSSLTAISGFREVLDVAKENKAEVIVYLGAQQEPFIGQVVTIDKLLILSGQEPADPQQKAVMFIALESIVAIEMNNANYEGSTDDGADDAGEGDELSTVESDGDSGEPIDVGQVQNHFRVGS
jgi:hypothetical protein